MPKLKSLTVPAIAVILTSLGTTPLLAWGSGGGGGGGGSEEFTYSGTTHKVYWLGAAWFPILTHVASGDRIEFNNLTGYSLSVRASNGSWSVSTVYGYSSRTLDVTSSRYTTFYGSSSNYSSYGYMSYGSLDDEVDYTYTSSDLLQPN